AEVWVPAERHHPLFARLPEEAGIAARVASPLLGGPLVGPFMAFVLYKPPLVGSPQPWHQDAAYLPAAARATYREVINIWIALDPAHRENACLEMVPGSHRLGLIPHHGTFAGDGGTSEQAQIDLPQCAELAPVAVELDPG